MTTKTIGGWEFWKNKNIENLRKGCPQMCFRVNKNDSRVKTWNGEKDNVRKSKQTWLY